MDNTEKLEHWFERHGSSLYDDWKDWVNSMSNLELLHTLEWLADYNPTLP